MDLKTKTSVADRKALSGILDELYEIHEHFEDIFSFMRCICSELESDFEDLLEDFEELAGQMHECSCHLLCLGSEPDTSEQSSLHYRPEDTFSSAVLINPSVKKQRRRS